MNNPKIKKFSNKAKAVVLGIAVLGAGGVGTLALLTDTSTTDISITSANFGLVVNDSATGSYKVDIDSDNMKPGDVRTGEITLTNESSIDSVITIDKSALAGFTSSVKDGDGAGAAEFSTVTLAEGESKKLTLDVTLPSTVTESPADQTLSITFNAEQTK